jgi:hypothetical protein
MVVQDPRILTSKTPETMLRILEANGKPLSSFQKGTTIIVWNKMEKNYTYTLAEAPGLNFDKEFQPHLTPAQILRLGAFEGKYLNDCLTEFPAEWFLDAIALDKLRPQGADDSVNLFQIHSRQPLKVWQENGWVATAGKKSSKKDAQYPALSDPTVNKDERGWFQWYCRYWMGRRIPELDTIQIKRWKAFARHSGGVQKNCGKGDLQCRPRQRQALLQWARDPFI